MSHARGAAWVFAGGTAGGLARYGLGLALPTSAGWPWGVFAANTAGAFLLAVLLVLLVTRWPTSAWPRLALGTGFCGAFTTMSGVAVTADLLVADGHVGTAAGFLGASAVAGLAAALAGLAAGRRLLTTTSGEAAR